MALQSKLESFHATFDHVFSPWFTLSHCPSLPLPASIGTIGPMKKPWLLLPAKLAHDLAPLALQFHAFFNGPRTYTWRPLEWRGLHFPNRLGIAGGVDKDGALIEEWWTYGPGFIEVGTVTPEPQGPNDGPIIGRDVESKALWNRMGFPGSGAYAVRDNLNDIIRPWPTPVFVNIGKNRTTPNENASRDYATCIEVLAGYADAFVVNISSPNTKGLRDLLKPETLSAFLGEIVTARDISRASRTPILLKLSPDMEDEDIQSVARVASQAGVDGFIATNTTLARAPGSPFPAEGGVSGAPLAPRSKHVLGTLVKALGSERQNHLIISVGGVMSPTDVQERLDLGADLVQVYTALIYEGPDFFKHVARHMGAIAAHDEM